MNFLLACSQIDYTDAINNALVVVAFGIFMWAASK